jgi:hypothetical protein
MTAFDVRVSFEKPSVTLISLKKPSIATTAPSLGGFIESITIFHGLVFLANCISCLIILHQLPAEFLFSEDDCSEEQRSRVILNNTWRKVGVA